MPHTSESLQASFKYLFPAEVQALKDLARLLPDNPVAVNIGAGSGTSGLAFMESRPDLKLITVDIQYDDSPYGCIVAERQMIERAGYPGDRYYYAVGDSKVIGQWWNELYYYVGKADLVFVDGDHAYSGCKGDVLAWLPNIKPGGIMAVHDYDKKTVYERPDLPEAIPHPLPWPGVDRAVRKFLCPKYEIVLHVDTLIAFRII